MEKINVFLTINRRVWLTFLIALAIYGITGSFIENSTINTEIVEFKEKGVFQEDFSNETTKFFIVPRETSQEKIPSFYIDSSNHLYPGRTGDILTYRQSTLTMIPFVSEFITAFFGGHAVIVSNLYKDNNIQSDEGKMIESTGLEQDDNTSRISTGGIRDIHGYSDTTIGLRVDTDSETKTKAALNAMSLVGNEYNYSFVFFTKYKDYCTDMISKAYSDAGVDLNYDKVATTVQDLDVSNKTYIFYYKFKDDSGVTNVYYLDDLSNRQNIKDTIF